MLVMQMSQAVTDGSLPNSAPFDRAPPQLSQLQMGIRHVDVQSRCDLLLTYWAKSRSIMPKRPLWSTTSQPTESLHLLWSFLHSPEDGFRPSSTKRSDILWGNMPWPPSRGRGQVFHDDIMETVRGNFRVRQHQPELTRKRSWQHPCQRLFTVENPQTKCVQWKWQVQIHHTEWTQVFRIRSVFVMGHTHLVTIIHISLNRWDR